MALGDGDVLPELQRMFPDLLIAEGGFSRDQSEDLASLGRTALIAMLVIWGRPWHALAIAGLVIAQLFAMRVWFRDPKGKAPWYNGTGVTLYVAGMMVSAFAIRTLDVIP